MAPSAPLRAAWVCVVLVAAGTSAGALFFVGAFARPHAFGGRDGQGAAGLAALIVLVVGALALAMVIAGCALGILMRRRGVASAPLWSLLTPIAAGLMAFLLGRFA